MYTSFGILALAGFLVAPSPLVYQEPMWIKDYQMALEKGAKAKKPLAVFVAKGQSGYNHLIQEANLNNSIKKTLADHYVCVFLDADSKSQQGLLQALAITKGQGLVLSDRTGLLQAFHHDGPLPTGELGKQLSHFAVPTVEVRTTVTNAQQRPTYVPRATVNC